MSKVALALGALLLSPAVHALNSSAPVECRLKQLSIELEDSDAGNSTGASTANASHAHAHVWLCCPPEADHDEIDAGCVVLDTELMGDIADVKAGMLARVDATNGTTPLAESARMHDTVVRSLGLARAVLKPSGMTVVSDESTFEQLDMVASADGGAGFVDRTSAHGVKKVLSVIVGAADAGNGNVHKWSCSVDAVRDLMWKGVGFRVGPSPWSSRSACRSSASCLYTVSDHLRSFSRGAVSLDERQSAEVLLPLVRNWPADFCNWPAIWVAIRAASASKGFNLDSYDHVVAFLPKHCAVAVGSQPGKFVLAGTCPRSGLRDDAAMIVAHELGHNVGFGHSGIEGQGAYDDQSSTMGATMYLQSTTLNMAHRHMFNWLPGLPASMHLGSSGSTELQLADPNLNTLPDGAVWGAEIRDGSRSWYVAYRACTGYDLPAPSGWCGAIQVSHRSAGLVTASHLAFLTTAGASRTFGSSNHITAIAPASVPKAAPTVRVQLRIGGSGGPIAAPAPRPQPHRRPACRAVTSRVRCRNLRHCRWRPLRRACTPVG